MNKPKPSGFEPQSRINCVPVKDIEQVKGVLSKTCCKTRSGPLTRAWTRTRSKSLSRLLELTIAVQARSSSVMNTTESSAIEETNPVEAARRLIT